MNTGIYAILNKINGKFYVGSSVDIQQRWYSHQSDIRKSQHHAAALQRAINKYGVDAFEYKILLYCDTDMLLHYEQVILNKYWGKRILYNSSRLAQNPQSDPEVHARAIAAAAEWHRGKPSPNRGISPSLEARNKISSSNKTRWKNNREQLIGQLDIAHEGRRGGHCSEEHKAAIAASNRQRWIDNPEKEQARLDAAHQANIGRHISESHRQAIIASNKRRGKKDKEQ